MGASIKQVNIEIQLFGLMLSTNAIHCKRFHTYGVVLVYHNTYLGNKHTLSISQHLPLVLPTHNHKL